MAEFLGQWILTLLIVVPVIGALAIMLYRRTEGAVAEAEGVRRLALWFTIGNFALALIALVMFFGAVDEDGQSLWRQGQYALEANYSWISDAIPADETGGATRYIDLRYHVGVDGLSVWLVLLSAGILPLCVWGSFSAIRDRVKEYFVLMLLLEAGLIGVFCARDLLIFYICFEFTLIPLYLLIGIWGGHERRRAANKFFIYTFAGSVFTFAGVLYLAYQAYQAPISIGGGVFTFDLDTLYQLQLDYSIQWWLFVAFAAGFAIKVPLFPFHTWLPLAHTEAPTAGSVLLAGVLLKLGTYGLLRFNLPLFPDASMNFAPLMAVLAIIGIIYAALVAWAQQDFKKLIAYSSVSHLGFCVLGMFSMKSAGLSGSLLYMVNHGLSTGALFFVVGMIYERYHTREFGQLGGLGRPMPRLAFFLILFSLSSIGLPGLNGFVSEFLVLVGTISSSSDMTSPAGPLGVGYAVFAALGIVLSAIYMLYMCRRLLFGPVKEPEGTPDISADLKQDLCAREIGVLAPIGFFCVLIGVWPNLLLSSIQPAAERQVLARVIQKPAVNEFQIVQQGLPPALTQEEPPGQQADGDQITTWRILFGGESEAAMRDESVSEHGPIVLNQKNSPKATY